MVSALHTPANDRLNDRQNAILDAAAKRFAQAGFHRTTMQDVAAEAGMSTGNLYRYFPSKTALIAGIVERDRAEFVRELSDAATEGDVFETLRALGRRHFVEAPRDKSMLCAQIWSEASRDPAIARLYSDLENEMAACLTGLFEDEKAKGTFPASVNCAAVARLTMKLADGMFVRRAASANFDAEREIGEVFALVEAMLSGAVAIPDPSNVE